MSEIAKQVVDLREEVLVVVEGIDAADAFAHGLKGEGTPLWNYKLRTPLFLLYFENYEKPLQGNAAEWISSFFVQQKSWQHSDTHGLPDRFYEHMGTRGVKSDAIDLLIYATLPGEHEAPQSVDAYLGRQDPALAIAATQALALLRLRSLYDGITEAINLPSWSTEGLRWYLFFGWRRVH